MDALLVGPLSLQSLFTVSGSGSGPSAANRVNTFSVIRDTLLSYPFYERLPHQAMELVEKTAPPFWYSRKTISAFTSERQKKKGQEPPNAEGSERANEDFSVKRPKYSVRKEFEPPRNSFRPRTPVRP